MQSNDIVTKGTPFIVSAPSGAGKTTLVKALISSVEGLTVSVSHTTRLPRANETDGVDYYFVSREAFAQLKGEGKFLEYAQVFDNEYGTSQGSVLERLEESLDVILEIDWQGAQKVREIWPHAVSIFILPPSRQTLESRLKTRAQDSQEVIARRLSEAVRDMSHYSEYDYLVINDDLGSALTNLQSIVQAVRLQTVRQKQQHETLLQSLLKS